MQDIINNAVITTMSEMSFLDVIPVDSFDLHELQKPLAYSIHIELPQPGEMVALLPSHLICLMGQNVWADKFDIHNEEMILDCIAEFLNVAAGKILQDAIPNILFELEPPQKLKAGAISLRDYQLHFYKTAEEEFFCVGHSLPILRPIAAPHIS